MSGVLSVTFWSKASNYGFVVKGAEAILKVNNL
jgi:hypothetical protein